MIGQLLSAANIVAGYESKPVLHGVSLDVRPGESVLLIGPNGCGKTTLLKVLAGGLRAQQGKIIFKQEDISARSCDYRARCGLGYLMQTRNVFPGLTVEENLHLSFWKQQGDYSERRNQILVAFPGLKERLNRRAGLLSGGERQSLAISMVLMRRVDLLLLDEPTAGLSPKTASGILQAIEQAQMRAGFATVVVEHNLRLVHRWVSRVLVMNDGRIVVEEPDPARLINGENLQKYYFG